MYKYFRLYSLVAIFFLGNFSYSLTETSKYKLSNETVNKFYDYISAERKSPDRFLITEDGTGSFVWACPQTLCFPASERFYVKPCSKFNKTKTCKIFAVKRKIKLIGSDEVSKNLRTFKSGDTLEEVINKLKKLGFVD